MYCIVHDALLQLQHLLAQADHYTLAGPDLSCDDAHPLPLPSAQDRPPPLPGEGERDLLCFWSVLGLNDEPETSKPTSPFMTITIFVIPKKLLNLEQQLFIMIT